MQLADKTIIITGASSGIGAAAALTFAEEGANVVLGARREALLDELVGKISHSHGHAVSLAGDIRSEAYAAELVRLANAEFGGLDAAFNNAGIMGDMAPIPDMASDNWQDVITTNLTSAFFAAKHQIPAMKDRGGGSIVFTSSFVGHTNAGMPGMGAYATSKAGLIGLVQSIAAEHGGDGIRANALLPVGTKTAMAGDDPAIHDYIAGLHPLNRMAAPEEIARAALFLLSDQSAFVTGSAMLTMAASQSIWDDHHGKDPWMGIKERYRRPPETRNLPEAPPGHERHQAAISTCNSHLRQLPLQPPGRARFSAP